jgi:cyclic pyranopterin phosphate synthase
VRAPVRGAPLARASEKATLDGAFGTDNVEPELDGSAPNQHEPGKLLDRRARPLLDLRVSVTDRCNFRCRYCMPREHFASGHRFLPRSEILDFEEITRVVAALAPLGLRKVRLTGGEPLLRSELPKLVERLAEIPKLDLALTTNAVLLKNHAHALKAAGLGRLTVSLDALGAEAFRAMADADYTADDVLEGIAAAEAAGFSRLRVNTVVRRGVNDEEILALARKFRNTGHVVRFIEYMDVGSTNGWLRSQVFSADEIVARIGAEFPLEPLSPSAQGEVARRFRYLDGAGEIGVVASVTAPFCGDCTRLRLSADGKLYTCLFASNGHDLRPVLRNADATDDDVRRFVAGVWRERDDRYSEQRALVPLRLRRVEMSFIGG